MKLILPDPSIQGKFAHSHDTFRELATMWKDYVEIEYSKNHYHPFLKYNDQLICLFDRPIYEEWSQYINTEYVLFGNPTPPKKFKYESSWIFWGRNPKKLEEARSNLLSYRKRVLKTFFAGKIENPLQHKKRTQTQIDWTKYIEDFSCPVNDERKYTQVQYLEKIKQSKFGLCLPGYGNKCNREIELLGLGTVPIVTKGVDVSNYFEPLLENIHYIYAEDGEDLLYKINKLTEEDWIYLSQSGLEWYERNCSPKGSFETTLKTIDKLMESPQSFSTLATDTAEKDLDLLYYSLRQQYPKHDLYLVCDDYIENWVKNKKDNFLHTNNALQKYANKNRTQMETDGTWTDFMLEKCTAIDEALSKHENTLFLDCDQCILDKIKVDTTKQLGFSQHLIKQQNENQFGKYNGGFIFINTKDFTKWWKDNTPKSKYMEQGILEEAPKDFTSFEFEPQYNFGWWRLFECNNPQERAEKFSYDTHLKYENKSIKTLHTHFFDNEIKNQSQHFANQFNNFVLDLMNDKNHVKKYIKNMKKEDGIILLQSYYNPKDKDRRKEIEYCLEQNLSNPSIKKVVLFLDNENVEYLQHDKIETFGIVGNELTYDEVFYYVFKNCKDEICCLINNDIFLDHDAFKDLTEITNLVNNNIVLSLSRHEYNVHTKIGQMDDNFKRLMFAHTQDAWIWKANFEVPDATFSIGILGADNAINDRLRKVNKISINLGSKYKVYHVDAARGKSSANFMNKDFRSQDRETYPDEQGHFLTPDYAMVQGMSLDQFAKQLNFNHIDTYEILCQMMTKKIKIKNR